MSLRTALNNFNHDPYKKVKNKITSILEKAKLASTAMDLYLQLRLFSRRPFWKGAIC